MCEAKSPGVAEVSIALKKDICVSETCYNAIHERSVFEP